MSIYVSYGILQIYTQSYYDTKRETPDEYKKKKKRKSRSVVNNIEYL